MQYQSLGWEDPLEQEMATHSTIPAWKFPWTEKPGGLQSMGLQKSQIKLRDNNNNYVSNTILETEVNKVDTLLSGCSQPTGETGKYTMKRWICKYNDHQ